MAGRVCVVTGANRGIGYTTALGLARNGADVVLVCRDASRAATAALEIDRTVQRQATQAIAADLSSMEAVRRAAGDIHNRYNRIDVLINNAAIVTPRRVTTVDGLETQFAVNHLAPFLLTKLLLPSLKGARAGRIINVASNAHYRASIDFDDLQFERRRYSPHAAYGQSKLANILFTRELARRIAPSLTANALHPGVISTRLLARMFLLPDFLTWVVRPFFKSPEAGARTSVFLASSPDVSGVTGRYFANCREKQPSAAAHDDEYARRLWNASEALLEE